MLAVDDMRLDVFSAEVARCRLGPLQCDLAVAGQRITSALQLNERNDMQGLEDQALASIGDALQQTLAIGLQNIGGDHYSVMSRGQAINSCQLEGVPTLDIPAQHVSQSLADFLAYDGVEVLRGAA